MRFLIKRLEAAEVVDRLPGRDTDQVFFGATSACETDGARTHVAIVGVDETDTTRGYDLLDFADGPRAPQGARGRHGDAGTPGGVEQLEILEVRYDPLATGSVASG